MTPHRDYDLLSEKAETLDRDNRSLSEYKRRFTALAADLDEQKQLYLAAKVPFAFSITFYCSILRKIGRSRGTSSRGGAHGRHAEGKGC